MESDDYSDLIRQAATEKYDEEPAAETPPITAKEAGMAGGTALGWLLGRQAQKSLVLPSEARNLALSMRNLEREVARKAAEHAGVVGALEQAQKAHEYLQSEQALIDRLPPELRPVAPSEVPSLTFTEGPEGVSGYQRKFIPKGFQSATGPSEGVSMQDVQRRLVPEAEAASLRGYGLAPGARRVTEAGDLYLPPEAQRALLERMQQGQQAEDLASEMARQQIYAQMEPERFQAARELSAAEKAAERSRAMLDSDRMRQAALSGELGRQSAKLSPGLQRSLSAARETEGLLPMALTGGARMLSKLAMPAAVASIPYETQQAINAYQQKQYMDALKHGIGAGASTLELAAPLALALGASPATAAGLGITGAVGGLGVLASDLPDIYAGLKEKAENYWKNR